MLPAMSKVISSTSLRFDSRMFCKYFITSEDFVPAIIATIEPDLPFAFLLVITVYNSPWESATSSIESCLPMFSG